MADPLIAPLTYLLKQSCCNKLCTRAPSMAGSRFCEWNLLRLAQLGKRVSAFPLMEAGVSESSSRGRNVSSTPFRTATYCRSELSILHHSRYSLLRQTRRERKWMSERQVGVEDSSGQQTEIKQTVGNDKSF